MDGYLARIMKTIIVKTIGCDCGWRCPFGEFSVDTPCPNCKNKLTEIKDLDKMIIMNITEEEEINKEIEKIEKCQVKNNIPDITTPEKKNAYIQQRKKEMADALEKVKKIEYKYDQNNHNNFTGLEKNDKIKLCL